jgi:predicted transcriptional regulator
VNNEEELKMLGLKFRKARESLGISQTELANKIGKDQPSINRLELGNINPSYIFMKQVCEGLDKSLAEVLNS